MTTHKIEKDTVHLGYLDEKKDASMAQVARVKRQILRRFKKYFIYVSLSEKNSQNHFIFASQILRFDLMARQLCQILMSAQEREKSNTFMFSVH
jgi:hypothetical protein